MRQQRVIGNWKMHGSFESIKQLMEGLLAGDTTASSADVVVCPSFPYLAYVADLLKGSSISLGAQNMCSASSGAFTGEVSAQMLKDTGCEFVILGHSERRTLFSESNELIAEKVQAAKVAGLIPILCIGETLADRDANRMEQVLKAQLDAVLNLPEGVALFHDTVVAYEPVWAIGTGSTASPEQVQQAHAFIRACVAEKDENIAQALSILYGGSVKPNNAASLFRMPDIDGGLIGGAALEAAQFLEIVLCIN